MNSNERPWRAQLTWIERDGHSRSQDASIVTLNPKTVKLSVTEEIPLHQECTIALLDRHSYSRLTVQATVHFLRAPRGDKQLTCRWAVPLSHSRLALLGGAGLYERRGEEREPVTLEAPAWPELSAPAGVIPLRIIDLSRGGCCLRSPLLVSVGHRVMVHVWGEDRPVASVRMRVQWQQPVEAEYLLGCAFTQKTGHRILSSFVGKEYSGGEGKRPKSLGLARRVMFLGQAGLLLSSVSSAAAIS